ncbi:hypothetical protein B296_00009956 [Ensete ventricosum]|uniref:Uncharacterized protein n=1 Tax=Ensete ventricosum TaxID=4639 RepID=A0A427AXZ9_ENSVE|nr:hypothetical protein B296_00009956 [Ensete ventricosum]
MARNPNDRLPQVETTCESLLNELQVPLRATDASLVLEHMEAQLSTAKEEAFSRKDILERVEKWLAACEEETWLEDYNRDENRYSAGRGAHLTLKRAEKARALVSKIPAEDVKDTTKAMRVSTPKSPRKVAADGTGEGDATESAVRALAPHVYPVGYLRRVGHVGGTAVRGCDDLVASVSSGWRIAPAKDEVGRKSGDLAERATSGANSEILAERVSSGANPEILVERVTSGANLEISAERMTSGANSKISTERVNSGANPKIWPRGRTRAPIRRFGREGDLGRKSGDLGREGELGRKPKDLAEREKLRLKFGDLAERVTSGANPEIWPRE